MDASGHRQQVQVMKEEKNVVNFIAPGAIFVAAGLVSALVEVHSHTSAQPGGVRGLQGYFAAGGRPCVCANGFLRGATPFPHGRQRGKKA